MGAAHLGLRLQLLLLLRLLLLVLLGLSIRHIQRAASHPAGTRSRPSVSHTHSPGSSALPPRAIQQPCSHPASAHRQAQDSPACSCTMGYIAWWPWATASLVTLSDTASAGPEHRDMCAACAQDR